MQKNETKKFDKIAYNRAYTKNNYKKMSVDLKPEVVDKIMNFCKDMNISRAKFVQYACLYVIDNNLFSDIVQYGEKVEKSQKKKKTPEEIAEEMNKGII